MYRIMFQQCTQLCKNVQTTTPTMYRIVSNNIQNCVPTMYRIVYKRINNCYNNVYRCVLTKHRKSAPTVYKIMQKCMDNCSNNVQKFVVTSTTSTFYINPSTASRSHYAIAARQGSRERHKPCPLFEPPSPSHQMERNSIQPSYITTKGKEACFSRRKNLTTARQEQKYILALSPGI